MNRAVITVNDLNLWYGQSQALKHITMEIPENSPLKDYVGQKFHAEAPEWLKK